jgi:hypothetical protein
MDQAQCISNLHSLYAGASLYVQQNGHWPQIDPSLMATDKKSYAKAWIAALQPMGIQANGWICPTVQRAAGNPDLTQDDNIRIDYLATPFDTKEMTPYRWKSQPWFAENNDFHGCGNLIIFTDGSVRNLNDVSQSLQGSTH